MTASISGSGYWGPEVGFYGGVDFGFGYPGVGFDGGYWQEGTYYYNRSVTNVDATVVHNTYNTTVVNNSTTVSGTTARASAQELQAANQRHVSMTSVQTRHQEVARTDLWSAKIRAGRILGVGNVVASRLRD